LAFSIENCIQSTFSSNGRSNLPTFEDKTQVNLGIACLR
jgi:hypothetical protein